MRLANLPDLAIPSLNQQFEYSTPEEILRWTWETFGAKAAASSSFQTQSLPLLHLISRVCPDLPIIFLDTGFHFPETLAFRDEITKQFKLNLIVAQPAIEKSQLVAHYGQGLYRRDPDLCCYLNKIEPMQRVVADLQAWVSGVRRDQTTHRQRLSVLEPQAIGLLKIHPILNWTTKEIWQYIDARNLPAHPLFAQGYLSIGCAPCTRPTFSGENEREGRWMGANKTECGLHLDSMNDRREHDGE